MSTENEYPKVLYSILDHPDRVAETGMSYDELKNLIEKYESLDPADFTFVGRRRD